MCKDILCRKHLVFICYDCIGRTTQDQVIKHKGLMCKLQDLCKQKYCPFCGPNTYRKVTKQCHECFLSVCKAHMVRICEKCRLDTV